MKSLNHLRSNINLQALSFLVVLCLFLPLITSASEAVITADVGPDSVNALEATINIPNGMNVSSVQTGGSAVLIWVEDPAIDQANRTITFSGITPGGFSGKNSVLTIIGEFTQDELDAVVIRDYQALRNDGKATPVSVKWNAELASSTQDSIPPAIFVPIIAQSGDAYNGNKFVAFLAQDKDSGVDHYEYAHKYLFKPKASDWSEAVSPIEIKGRLLDQEIYIKAVDRAGNERVAMIHGPDYYRYRLIWTIILILVICGLYCTKRYLHQR